MKIKDLRHTSRAPSGLVGLEFEVEGERLPDEVPGWNTHSEGSLREYHGYPPREYVMAGPSDFWEGAIRRLGLALNRSTCVFSERTSVHLHVNVNDLEVQEYINFIILWILYEEAFISYCSNSRKGNLFCLSSNEAQGMFEALEKFVSRGFNLREFDDGVRYAALNLAATVKFGSLEFRCLEGTDDMERVRVWVKSILRLRKIAKSYSTDALLKYATINSTGLTTLLFKTDECYPFITEYRKLDESYERNLARLNLIFYNIDWGDKQFLDEPLTDE